MTKAILAMTVEKIILLALASPNLRVPGHSRSQHVHHMQINFHQITTTPTTFETVCRVDIEPLIYLSIPDGETLEDARKQVQGARMIQTLRDEEKD